MTPWLEDPDVTLYHGDCLDVLRQLPSGSVHMCATSPPFYGLRDYGTGEWEGGNPDCDHMDTAFNAIPQNREGRETPGGRGGSFPTTERQFKTECDKCGARRVDQQIGLEETPDQWVDRLVAVFREVRRVLRDDGTLWVEIGDSYGGGASGGSVFENGRTDGRVSYEKDKPAGRIPSRPVTGTKPKDLLGQPWLLAFALRADGWYLRSEIIWARPNPMPESVTDRPTKSHSTIFLLSKQARYFFDQDAIRSPHQHDGRKVDHVKGTDASHQHRDGPRWPDNGGANARSVWQIATEPTPYAHFATWPRKLVARMIQAGTSERGCCPECGAPWVRDTASELVKSPKHSTGSVARGRGEGVDVNGWAGEQYPRLNRQVTTLGWSPSCNHDHQPVPCTVLDPFAGSGTTNLVARNHGRHSIGIELNAEYLKIAADRLSQLSLVNDEMFA